MRGLLHTGPNRIQRAFTSDNFYEKPDDVRHFALGQMFYTTDYYVGSRTEVFMFENTQAAVEEILGHEVVDWDNPDNGRFEAFIGGDLNGVMWDKTYDWNGFVFLNPNPPAESGITLQVHKETGSFVGYDGLDYNPLDKFQFNKADVLGNIYNRLVLVDGKLLKNYSEYFGWDIPSGMLVQTFKFNSRR